MKVWLVNPFDPLPADGLPVTRYRQLARELSRRRHDVTWWTADFFHFRKQHRPPAWPSTPDDPYAIRLVHAPAYHDNASLRRVWSHASLAVATLHAMNPEADPDLIVAAVPPVELPAASVALGATRGVPTCIDVGDPWPDAFAHVLPPTIRPLAPTLLWPHSRLMSWALRRSTAVTASYRTYLDWALARRRGPAPAHSAIFLPAAMPPDPPPDRSTPGDPLRITFCGTFGLTYDLELILDAAAQLERTHPGRFRFTLVGDGPQLEQIRARARRRCPHVGLPGPMRRSDLDQTLTDSDVGLCCYRVNAPQSLTTKLFQYLSHGLPVLGTLPGEMAAFLAQHGVGLTALDAPGCAHHARTHRSASSTTCSASGSVP